MTVESAEPDCTCGRLAVGMTVTEVRNWHPDCPAHGMSSVWWNSQEQREKRDARRAELIDLQLRAREARRRARENES